MHSDIRGGDWARSDSGYILKVEPYEKYADGLDVRMRERVDPKMIPSFLA